MKPITRKEQFIAAREGHGEMPKPLTRDEVILAGGEIEPLTRDEACLMALANGGGGGGDLSEATMTIVKNGVKFTSLTINASVAVYSPYLQKETMGTHINIYSQTQSGSTFQFVLYQGSAEMKIYEEDGTGFSVDGNAEIYDDEGVLYIYATGDFTLVIP